MNLRSRGTWAIAVVALLVCATIALAMGGVGNLKGDKKAMRVELVANATSVMVGEPISFHVEVRSGTPQAWLWDLGDGTIGINATAEHSYETSAYYNVTVAVIGMDGQNVSDTIVVAVQNYDVYEAEAGDVIAFPSRNAMAYDLIYFELYSGISRANITAKWSGTSVTVEVAIFIMTNPTDQGPRLVSESMHVPAGHFEILRELTVPEDALLDYEYIMVLQANGGVITNYLLELTVEY